mgnify:CR=1 FL=1
MDTKKLRQKILDLAIRGKLVPQDPNDEPASVLLERIKEEKERLIKEGKIKKSKKTVSSDTYHYENKYLPKGWTICSLDDLATFGGGKTPSMDNRKYWNNAKHLWITSKDMKFAHIADSLLKISDAALDQMTIYGKGTLLIVTRSGILRHTFPIAILDTEATVNQDVKAISCVLSHIHTYLYYVIKAQEQVILKDYHKDGTTVDSIDFDKFKKLIVPLPPLSEQYRIVEEIEHWFALIDQIEQGKTDLQTTIKQIKGKILDLAIHGKLVPQNPNDEPAIELLKRINPDFTPCDNGHYTQLPDGWAAIKVGDVAIYINGRAFKPEDWMCEGLPIIRIQNLNDKNAGYNRTTKTYESKYLIHNGDLLFAWAASLGTYIWNGGNAWLNQHIFKVEPYQFIEKSYLYYIFKTMTTEFYAQSHGSGMVHITKKQFENIELLLPPLKEQKRIVQTLEQISTNLDQIVESL